jgi:hypothetical protein
MDLQPEVSIVLIMASTKVLYQFVTYASCGILDSDIGWHSTEKKLI